MATVSSGYYSTEPILVPNSGNWSFVAVESPTIAISNVKVQQPLNSVITETLGVFKPLGNSKTVVVAASIYGVDGTYEFTIVGEDEWETFYPVLTYQGTFHVHDPLGRQKYVRFADRNWTERGDIGSLIRDVKVTYYEVDAP